MKIDFCVQTPYSMFACSVVGFTQEPRDRITPFFVKKKGGRLRLIVDARLARVAADGTGLARPCSLVAYPRGSFEALRPPGISAGRRG